MRLQVHNREDGSTFDYEVTKPEVYVGTSSTNDIVVYQPSLSGRHLKIRVDGDRCEVLDMGSRTGTFLNGMRIRGPEVFKPSDVVSLGSYTIRIVEDHLPAEPAKPKEALWEILDSPEKRFDESLVPIKQEIHRKLLAFLDLRRLDLKNIDDSELRVTTGRAIWSIMDAIERGDSRPGSAA